MARNSTKGMIQRGTPDLTTASFELEVFSVITSSRVQWPEADIVTADFKIQTDSLAQTLAFPVFGQHGIQEELIWPLGRHSRYFTTILKP